LAKRLGVSENTIGKYLDNSWTVLDRSVLERLLDFLGPELMSLLRTKETKFFDPFGGVGKGRGDRSAGASDDISCLYLRRPDADDSSTEGKKVAFRDNEAMRILGTWFQDSGLEIETREHAATTREEFERKLSKNCIVIGSPIVNNAAEFAICRAFGLTPFDVEQRPKLPFTFRVSIDGINATSVIERSSNGEDGIWLRDAEVLLKTERWPFEQFKARHIREGKDYAVVMVVNRPSEEGSMKKLMVLAGVSGLGTEAAAIALRDNYRNLEPIDSKAGVAWGVIEVVYTKSAKTARRELLRYTWRYRSGGRSPIDFARKADRKPSWPLEPRHRTATR
jgi:hypothetical protein